MVTVELIAAGASPGGGYTREQLAVLGVDWPPPKGWKARVIGQPISEDDAGKFVNLRKTTSTNKSPVNWCGHTRQVEILLYVLELEHSCFYVGLTSDVDHRIAQHLNGEGAEWTKIHRPTRLLYVINTGTTDGREAELLENEITVELMIRHGIDYVRGGHFCYLEKAIVEHHLYQKGAWERIVKAKYDKEQLDTEKGWAEALDDVLGEALAYYDAGAPLDQREAVFAAICRLSRYCYWHSDYSPALNREFWDVKGVLPVLLSFKLGRPVGSKLAGPFDILAAALNRGRNGTHPLRRLFLLAWQAYTPTITDRQAATLSRFMTYLDAEIGFDGKYDAFVAVLFPETRHLFRESVRSSGTQ